MDRSLVWFRKDLRLQDNPAILAASEIGAPTLFVFLDERDPSVWETPGEASKWWLGRSLQALTRTLNDQGHQLLIMQGNARHVLPELVEQLSITHVFWNRRYTPQAIEVDTELKRQLSMQGVSVESCNGSLLIEPWTLLNQQKKPYKVYTPFRKEVEKRLIQQGVSLPGVVTLPPALTCPEVYAAKHVASDFFEEPAWAKKIADCWQVGERAALAQLDAFCVQGLQGYKEGRNFPSTQHVSRLSPYLAWGEICPQRIIARMQEIDGAVTQSDVDHFVSEVIWREFAYYLLYHFPTLPEENFNPKFDHFAWRADNDLLDAWQRGKTGYPIVDAGMRELWSTGWMHNRVRMIVASFLIKDLLIHWRDGEAWFWNTLVDADLANNAAGWQWVAGSGADAAPYFRIFNPVTQGEKFDANGDYVRRWIPELKQLDKKWIHRPWEAPTTALEQAHIVLGKDYPMPLVDHAQAREAALSRYKQLKDF